METKFNFNSQICTTREQSERLLSLGLKKETADCALLPLTDRVTAVLVKPSTNDIKNTIPAWSLGRLIEIKVMKTSSQILLPLDNTFDGLIEDIETRIKGGYFNKEYLEEQI